MLNITEIQINHLKEPKGISKNLIIGWKIKSSYQNVLQTGYQFQILGDSSFEQVLYDSGRIESEKSQNLFIDISEICRKSLCYYYVRARIWDNYGEESEWYITRFLTALLKEHSWKADFITAERLRDKIHSPATRLRKEFIVKKTLKHAFLIASAQGLYQTFLNGSRVGNDELTPGWTNYNKRLLYQTYEVTGQLVPGVNTWSALVGAGWYKGDVSYYRIHNFYGDYAAFSGELILRYEDGSEECIFTDGSWKGASLGTSNFES